jgi:hypothetical protein
MTGPFASVRRRYPDFDPTPFQRTLRAYYEEPYKFIAASNGQHELYNLDDDPAELRNLIRAQPETAQRLAANLRAYLGSLHSLPAAQSQHTPYPLDEDQRRRLEILGYVVDADEADQPTQAEGADEGSKDANGPSDRP